MKSVLILSGLILMLMTAMPGAALCGGSGSLKCDTRYPVVLAHGMGATAEMFGFVEYWYGIPEALRDQGADVYAVSVNAMGSTETKAAQFKTQLLQILAVTGKAKANVIGHSHGGIYPRYAITNMGLASKVASLTSIGAPHRGSTVVDVMVSGLPGSIFALGSDLTNFMYAFICGDTNPDFATNAIQLTTGYMRNIFNPNTPNVSGVYYQSYNGKVKVACPFALIQPCWLLLLATEGESDGATSTYSAKWGTWKGTVSGAWYSPGVDHLGEVGQLLGATPGFDAPGFYVGMVGDLKAAGF
ncbi:MAG: alpha/beta fold hydrolase [Deltaproteobacteria bacterium]|nr:alpha/beta fold hydrolase [Deltaproteobacteria bacterium]